MDKDININNNHINDKEECKMAVYAIKSKTPFITNKKELKGKKPSEEYLERRRYINSHNFIFDTDEETGELKVIVTEKDSAEK